MVRVADGMDIRQVMAAQRAALALDNGQPTAIVYQTTKGWRYGIEGKASHGAGHGLCTDRFVDAIGGLLERTGSTLSRCEPAATRCSGGAEESVLEECFWEALGIVRRTVEANGPMVAELARRLGEARKRLDLAQRRPRPGHDAHRLHPASHHGLRGGRVRQAYPPPGVSRWRCGN